jgi:hypothetical protein
MAAISLSEELPRCTRNCLWAVCRGPLVETQKGKFRTPSAMTQRFIGVAFLPLNGMTRGTKSVADVSSVVGSCNCLRDAGILSGKACCWPCASATKSTQGILSIYCPGTNERRSGSSCFGPSRTSREVLDSPCIPKGRCRQCSQTSPSEDRTLSSQNHAEHDPTWSAGLSWSRVLVPG